MTILRSAAIFFLLGVIFPMYGAAQDIQAAKGLFTEKKYAQAKMVFESLVAQNKKDAEAHSYLAAILLRNEFRDLDAAEEHIDEALDIDGSNSRYHLIRGQALGLQAQNANPFKAALLAPKVKKAFLRAVELNPNNVEARSGLFSFYLMAPGIMGGSEELAFEQAKETEKIDPFAGYQLFASYYQKKKDSTNNEKYLKLSVAKKPTDVQGRRRLSSFYSNQKKFSEAIADAKKFVEIEPKNSDAYIILGDGFFACEQIDEAIKQYSTALSIENNHPGALYAIGLCYEKKGDYPKAKDHFQRYLTVDEKGRRADAARKKINELK